ncbi:MAG: polysaccharide deacetylase family protein [Thermoproteales archaeon]|nr:polysaccharide deacetylase family protein [Thermoproteales archaeon]
MEKVNNILSIDLEDWRHIHYLQTDQNVPERILENTEKILEVLSSYNTNATFFVLGEIVENYPSLIKKIIKEGHEIAFHTWNHTPLWDHNIDSFRSELVSFKKLMKRKFNTIISGFRAPVFSLNKKTSWAIKTLRDEKYIYDSSIFPIYNPVYGTPNAPIYPYYINESNVSVKHRNGLIELPLLTYSLLGLKIPTAGGIYLRFLPEFLIHRALKKYNKKGYPGVIYLHPREIDAYTPSLNLPFYKKILFTYNNGKTLARLERMLKNFSFDTAISYIESNKCEI